MLMELLYIIMYILELFIERNKNTILYIYL